MIEGRAGRELQDEAARWAAPVLSSLSRSKPEEDIPNNYFGASSYYKKGL